ncbi:hypothetical protein REPUB_Repub15cG0123000 [Reevesia pubescens]
MDSAPALKVLVDCAQAIQVGNLKVADSLLERIWNLAAAESDENQKKVLKYFAEALVRRAYGLHPTNTYALEMAPRLLFYFFWLYYPIMSSLKDSINNGVMGKKRLHLIDFYVPDESGYLFDGLPDRNSGDPLSVRVSVILPPFLEKTVNVEKEKQIVHEKAKRFNLELEGEDYFKVVYSNSLGEVDDESMLDFRRTEDEAVVVYYNFKFQRLLADEGGAMKRELLKLRQINPEVVILIEQYANHNDSNFITRLKKSFQYYSQAFSFCNDIADCKMMRRQIGNIVGCEGKDRIVRHQNLVQWQSLLRNFGFLPIPIPIDYYSPSIREENGCLVWMEENRPMIFVSAWKLTQSEDHFNPISYYNFVQGSNPIRPEDTVQPLQIFPEGCLLSRFAARIEIYDMLEEICCKSELQLALTWACMANVNEIMSDSYKKRFLFIERTSCYAHNWESQDFMKRCAETHLLEGQAIAGKALQSSEDFHFEPSITKLKKRDHPLAGAAREFAKRSGNHAIVAICLQNHYTIDDVYVVELFFDTAVKRKNEVKKLAYVIFNDLKNMKKKFVTLRVQGTEVGFQEEALSNIPQGTITMTNPPPPSSTANFLNLETIRYMNTIEPKDDHAMETQGLNEQGGVIPNFQPYSEPIYASSPTGTSPFNAPNSTSYNGVLETIVCEQETSDNDIVKANRETSTVPRTRKSRLRSEVWKDFIKLKVDGKEIARCSHCDKDFTGQSTSGTTHLKNHLKSCPSKKSDSTNRNSNERNSIFYQEKSRLDFAKMIIKHQYPLNMADQEYFKNFVKNLQPLFEFQPQPTILTDIHRIYGEEKKKLQRHFDQLACKFSLTISLMKGNLRKNAYCCLIAHFIDDDWELKMKILAFKNLENIYDTGALSGIIGRSVSEWNMGKKVCSITVDNSSLNDDIVQQIKESCFRDQGSFLSSHCFTSCTLVQDGLHEIDDILLKMRKSIEYVSEISHEKLRFEEALKKVKLHGGKSTDDLPLRLDSDFGTFETALELRDIFCQQEQIDGNFKVNPSMEEWDKALALHSCLKGFEGTDQSLTANVYFPKLCNVYNKFLQLEKSNYPFASLMKRKFDNYWSLCNLVFAVAAVLDPQLKFKFVEFSYCQVYGCDSKKQLNRLHKVLVDVYYEYANELSNLTTSASAFGEFSCSTSTHNAANDCILDSFSRYISAGNFTEAASWKSELDIYLDEPVLTRDGALFDILGWWRVNSSRFPTLERMARDILAIPMSVVPPCSDLNALITNSAYSSLNHESMEALVCSQNWLEMPKGRSTESNSNMAKRKMEEKETRAVKSFKNWNNDKTSVLQNENAQQEGRPLRSSEPSHGRDISGLIEIPNGDPSFDNQSEFQSDSSESDGETALREQGAWHEKDVRAYLISSFTEKEKQRLNRWQSHEMSGNLIGRDKEFSLAHSSLAPLLIIPSNVETRVEYYIDDSTFLIKGSRTEDEVLAWFKDEKLIGVHKLFLPLCLSAHWTLFSVDTKEQKFSWLDSNISSRMSNNVEKGKILGWFTRYLLPAFGYNNANKWPFELRNDIPPQNNLVDCGLFVMKYADCLAHGNFFPFAQEDMAHFRYRTFLDIYRGRLHRQK